MSDTNTLSCPHCGSPISVTSELSATVTCPQCHVEVRPVDGPDADSLSVDQPLETMASEASIDTATVGDVSGDAFTSQDDVSGISYRADKLAAAAPTLRTVDRFEIKGVLGVGGFGKVYRAWDPHLERVVALKIPTFGPRQKTRLARFISEAKAAARLQHPHIVSTYEVGRADGRPFIASECIDGVLMSECIKQTTPAITQSVQWIRKLADALHYAHQQGIIHRDVKPHNVMINSTGEPQLMDFGLAKRLDDNSRMTTDGALLGTPTYMSPEQARGELSEVKAASDQYSLGVVLFRLLTGTTPHVGSPHLVISRVATGESRSAREILPELDTNLNAICEKAMAVSADDRYASCEELAADLQAWENGTPLVVRPPSAWARLRKATQIHGLLVGFFAVIIVLGFTAATLGWKLMQRPLSVPQVADREPPAPDANVDEEPDGDVATGNDPATAPGETTVNTGRNITPIDPLPAPPTEGQTRRMDSRPTVGSDDTANAGASRAPKPPEEKPAPTSEPVSRSAEKANHQKPSIVASVVKTAEFTGQPLLSVKGWSCAWGPDGQRLLYNTGNVGPNPGGMLKWKDIVSGQEGDIVVGGKDEVSAPGGSRLVAYETGGVLSVCRMDGTKTRELGRGGYPSWSEDGNALYFRDSADREIKRVDVTRPDAKPESIIACRSDLYPAISPNGKWMAHRSGSKLIVTNIATRTATVTHEAKSWKGILPGWSPDSRFVAFGSYGYDGVGLWVLNVESGTVAKVLNGSYTLPRWSADGVHLACDDRQKKLVCVFRVEDLALSE